MSAGLVVLLAITFALYVRSEKQVDRAHELRHRSFLLADELRQSSDDLTRMVRTYVVTGDPVYKQHYQDILDIRNGKTPRPEGYWRVYWDLVLPGGQTPRSGGQQTIALLELMRQAGFTEEEFRALAEAKANSDRLTVPEFEAMKLVESTGPEAEANRARARTMMFDEKYHQAKAAIMKSIDEFYVLVDQRTLAAVQTAENHVTVLRYMFVAFGLGLMIMLWRTYAALRDTLGGSVNEVYAQIARIGSGDCSSAIQMKDALKNSVLGWLSETQVRLSDSDRERQLEGERLRLVVEAAPNGIIVVSEAGTITLVNAQTEKAFGYTRAELVGQPIEALVPERFRAAHPAQRRGFFADPKARAMGAGRDLFGRRKDGSEFPLEIGLSPITTREGLVVLAAVVDVTERKRAEGEREQLTRELQLLLESTGEGIYGIDLEGRFMFINRAALGILGFTREELLGRNAHQVVHHTRKDGSAYPVQECPIFRAFRTGQGCRRDDEVLWRSDGTSFPAEYASYPILQQGASTGAVVTFSDITERKQFEAALRLATEQAQAADRLKSAFLATMSHELRTPLNSIIGFTGIILQGLAGPLNPEQAKQLEMVRGSARHLLALINDILDISKIEAGQLEVCCEPLDLRASITNVTNTVRPLAEKKGLALNVEVSPAVAGVVSDKRRVEQVLLNLLSNAVKFTEKGGVALRAEVALDDAAGAARPVVRLSVADTGMGIKTEDLDLLFRPFRQIDSGLSRNHEGTGLGLAICRRLAELLGGKIRAESEWGKGSVFTFIMPLKEPVKS
jgi:protein-histidine pros-kinase